MYPTLDQSSSFIVVSMGSSSTQAYHVVQGHIDTLTYETGTGNLKLDQLQKMATDLIHLDKCVLFINSIGFGVADPTHFLSLTEPDIADYLSRDESSVRAILTLRKLLDDLQAPVYVVNSRIKPKFKNDWTHALSLELKLPDQEHYFFVDYGGGSISVQHGIGQHMDENALAKLKYDQDAILRQLMETHEIPEGSTKKP